MPKQVVPEERRRRRRPTKSGRVLSEALIVDTALRLLHEHGGAGLTARRLGLALDCDPSTLYRYFRGMDDLTLAIGDALIGRALRGWRPTGQWREDLRSIGLRIHAAYLSHPQAAVLTASRVSGRANELAADEAVLEVLRGAGFPLQETVRIYHAFIDTTLAFAALDAASLALPTPPGAPTRTCGARPTPASPPPPTRASPRPRPSWPPAWSPAPTRRPWRCS